MGRHRNFKIYNLEKQFGTLIILQWVRFSHNILLHGVAWDLPLVQVTADIVYGHEGLFVDVVLAVHADMCIRRRSDLGRLRRRSFDKCKISLGGLFTIFLVHRSTRYRGLVLLGADNRGQTELGMWKIECG